MFSLKNSLMYGKKLILLLLVSLSVSTVYNKRMNYEEASVRVYTSKIRLDGVLDGLLDLQARWPSDVINIIEM